MKRIGLMLVLVFVVSCTSQKKITTEKTEIKETLESQARAWTNGDLVEFMQGYWKSDSLQFIGKSGITYGWQQTLDNYKKGYPTPDHTGELTFNILRIDPLSKNLYAVVGEYHLVRKVGNADGIYTLIFKKIDGGWKIISDHSD